MAHLALVAPPFLGHMNPMRALARALAARGHRATFLHMPDAAPLVDEPALAFRPVGAGTHPPGELPAITARLGRVSGLLGLRPVLRDVERTTAMLAGALPAALRAIGADLVIADGAEPGAALGARGAGLPWVSVANALPLNREPGVPPPFTGWRYDATPWGLERNRGGYRVSDWLLGRLGGLIAARSGGEWRTLEDCLSPLAQISQTVAGFDVPRAEAPAHFHPVGPLRSPARPSSFRLPAEDGRPLVYATLGSLQGRRAGLLATLARGGARAGATVVLSHGGLLDPRRAAKLSRDADVHGFVPQEVVLARASAAIVNGGLNTVMDALARGVPLVVVPIAFEQAATAARVERCGAGRVLAHRLLTVRRVAAALTDILADGSYRENAARLAGEIAEAGGVERAADIVEAVLATGRPVLRDRRRAGAGR